MAEDLRGALGWGAVFIEQQRLVLFGWEETRGDGVDAHALGGPFARQKL